MSIESKLKEKGLELPATGAPVANYVPYVKTGNLLYVSGMLSMLNGAMTHTGKVGKEHSVEEGYKAAQVCVLNTLAQVKHALGDLSKVKRVVFLSGFVNGIDGFPDAPAVINGASDLLVHLYGDSGKHARAALTVAGLPRNSLVEVQCVFEV